MDFVQQCFLDRNEFRDWLMKNHDSESGLWLVYYKKATKVPCISYEESVEETRQKRLLESIELLKRNQKLVLK